MIRRSPAAFADRDRCAYPSLGLRFARPRYGRSAPTSPLQADALRAQGIASGLYDSILSLGFRLRGHPAYANKSYGRDAARDRRSPTQTAGIFAGQGGWIAPLGQTASAFADDERSESLAAVATRRAPLPSQTPNAVRRCSADSVALSHAGDGTAGATFADAERSDALRSLGPGRRPVDQLIPKSKMLHFVTFWTSSRSSKSAAPLPLASASAARSLNLPRLRAKKVWAALVPLRSRLRSGDAQNAQGSSAGHHDCFFLRSRRRRAQRGASQQAHTAPPRTGRAGRPAAALRNNLQEQVVEMGEKKHHQVAVFSTSRSNSTRRAGRSAPNRSLSLDFACFRHRLRVDIFPRSMTIFRQQCYRNHLTGLRCAPMDASLFYNISLPKAWRVSAPLPAGFAAACRSRQHGHPRKAASSRTCAGCFPRRQPGASISSIIEVNNDISK